MEILNRNDCYESGSAVLTSMYAAAAAPSELRRVRSTELCVRGVRTR